MDCLLLYIVLPGITGLNYGDREIAFSVCFRQMEKFGKCLLEAEMDTRKNYNDPKSPFVSCRRRTLYHNIIFYFTYSANSNSKTSTLFSFITLDRSTLWLFYLIPFCFTPYHNFFFSLRQSARCPSIMETK